MLDTEQIKDGVNKDGDYQFGKHTCPYCKNPDTEQKDDHWYCFMCTGKFNSKPNV